MAFTDCMTPTHLNTEKNGLEGKNWIDRMRFLFSPSRPVLQLIPNQRLFRATVDDVNQWAQSFDKLLSHKCGRNAFHLFMKSEYCEENIEFWIACEDYRALTWHRQRLSKANSIYEEFVKTEAPKEINLDFHTKSVIIDSLHEPTATIFLAAQRKIYSLMENNSYPRFIHSDLYKEMRAAARR